jgi:hypothetical protein
MFPPGGFSPEDMAMRTEYLEELGDTLFIIATAGAIGLGAANLAMQVTKERAAFDAATMSHDVGQVASPAPPTYGTVIPPDQSAGQLGY